MGFDCADGLERQIKCHPATHPYFKCTFIKAYKPCAPKNYHVSADTAFRAWLDCTKTSDVIHKNSPGRNLTGRIRLSRMDPLPGSIDCTHRVCGVVRFDCVDGLGRVIQHYVATRPYFEDTFINSWESCSQKNYRKKRPRDLWRKSYHLRLSPTFPMFGKTNIEARLMAYPNYTRIIQPGALTTAPDVLASNWYQTISNNRVDSDVAIMSWGSRPPWGIPLFSL